jgi:hypothetical protein
MEKLGLPIAFVKLNDSAIWRFRPVRDEDGDLIPATHNRALFLLNSAYTANDFGNVMAIRRDRRALLASHLDAIINYCISLRRDMPHDEEEYEDEDMPIQSQFSLRKKEKFMLQQANKLGFLKYYYGKWSKDQRWETRPVPSPYMLKDIDAFLVEQEQESKEKLEDEITEEG